MGGHTQPIFLPSLALGAGLVSGGFFLGIGFALVKQLVGVDIGFTHLADFWDPHQRLRWGLLFSWHRSLHQLIRGVSVEVHPGGCPHRSGESDGGFLSHPSMLLSFDTAHIIVVI